MPLATASRIAEIKLYTTMATKFIIMFLFHILELHDFWTLNEWDHIGLHYMSRVYFFSPSASWLWKGVSHICEAFPSQIYEVERHIGFHWMNVHSVLTHRTANCHLSVSTFEQYDQGFPLKFMLVLILTNAWKHSINFYYDSYLFIPCGWFNLYFDLTGDELCVGKFPNL